MRYGEYEVYEKGDRVKIEGTKYCGEFGIVVEDQEEIGFMVKVKLDNSGKVILVDADNLVYKP